MARSVSLRTALNKLGCTEIKLSWNGGPASRDQSGFFVGGGKIFKEGQLYYITYSPMFQYDGQTVMYREALSRKDFSGQGGYNNWGFEYLLKRDYNMVMDGKAQ